MKTTQFNSMKKAAEVLAAFGDGKNAAQVKRYMALEATITKIEGTTQKNIVDAVLADYKPVLKQLPKEVRGATMKAFCAAINEVLSSNGTMFVFDMAGNIVSKRAVAKISKRDNEELFTLLGNLFESKALEEAQKRAEERKEEERKEAYLAAMDDELNEYSVAQLIAA